MFTHVVVCMLLEIIVLDYYVVLGLFLVKCKRYLTTNSWELQVWAPSTPSSPSPWAEVLV